MFNYIDKKFSKRRKAQKKVLEFFLKNGVKVGKEDKKMYFSSEKVEIPASSIARVLDIDRRIVKAAIETIHRDKKLREIFSKLNSGLLLRDVAPELGFGSIEILVHDPREKGIVAEVTKIISKKAGLAIRQLTAEDPTIENAELSIVTEKPIPRKLIDEILKIPNVEKVIVLS